MIESTREVCSVSPPLPSPPCPLVSNNEYASAAKFTSKSGNRGLKRPEEVKDEDEDEDASDAGSCGENQE